MRELELLYQQIEDDLCMVSPIGRHEFYLEYLKERFPFFNKHYRVKFLKEGDAWCLSSWKAYGRGMLKLEAPMSSDQQEEPDESSCLLSEVCATLNLSMDSIESVMSSKKEDCIILEIIVLSPFEELKRPELRLVYFDSFLQEGMEQIKRAIHRMVFQFTTDQLKEEVRRIQHQVEYCCQSILARLPEEEHCQLYKITQACTDADIVKTIYYHLEDFLLYLEKRCAKYFDLSGPVPNRRSLLAALTYQQKRDVISETLKGQNIDPNLIRLVLEPINAICYSNDKVTYKQLSYVDRYFKEIHQRIAGGFQSCVGEEEVINLLFSLNFNSLNFYHYLILRIKKMMDKTEWIEGKLQELQRQLRNCRQITPSIADKYEPDLAPVYLNLVVWIEEEIAYLQYCLINNKEGLGHTSDGGHFKMPVNMSVEQLSFFARLAFDAGLIEPASKQDLFRFLCLSYKTPQQENLALSSVGNKFYSIEDKTRKSVIQMIQQMLDLAKTSF